MKPERASQSTRGFTLVELMVAMAITAIIVMVLVSITSVATDTWNRSRSVLRAARQAKAMVDTMAHDFEALVTRRGNENEWLSAIREQPGKSTNATKLVFFTAATDRYNGEIGKGVDLGGDVSCVGYQLAWKDPISGAGFETFVLNRLLVDPRETFDTLLGKPEIGSLFPTRLSAEENFVCENIFQFTLSFHLDVTPASGGPSAVRIVKNIGPSMTEFRIKGTGIETLPVDDSLKAARIKAVEISLTVLSDSGVNLLREAPGKADDPDWLAKNSYHYSKLIQLPGM